MAMPNMATAIIIRAPNECFLLRFPFASKRAAYPRLFWIMVSELSRTLEVWLEYSGTMLAGAL